MKKKRVISSYEITPQTMAIIAHYNEKGNLISHVLETHDEFYVELPPTKIIDESCKFFGASLKGRQEGTFNVSGFTHKVPISVDPTNRIYFFPTASPLNSMCSWIAHSYVLSVNDLKENGSDIVFNNGQKRSFKVSCGSLRNQVQRTAQFRFLLDQRISY